MEEKYNILNKSFDNDDEDDAGQRLPAETASHVKDVLKTLSKQLLLPALFHHYPELIDIEIDSQDNILENPIYSAFTQTFFGPHHKTNTPMVAVPKIIEFVKQRDRNAHRIQSRLLENKQIQETSWYMPTTKPVKIDSYFIVPLSNAKSVKNEGDTLKHCVYTDHLSQFTSGHALPYGIREHIDKPFFTAAICSDKKGKYKEYHEPQGLYHQRNSKVDHVWKEFIHQLNKGTWGKPKNHIMKSKEQGLHAYTVAIGFNPFGPDCYQKAEKSWNVLKENMGDLLRYRHFELDEMLNKSGILGHFDKMAKAHNIETRPFPGLNNTQKDSPHA